MSIENDLIKIKEIINEIEEKSRDESCVYRGERQCNDKVSSTLYRDFDGIDGFNIEKIEKEMLNGAKKHTGHHPLTGDLPKDFRPILARMFSVREEDTAEAVDFELLTEIQHYGGKTNLIDFTTDFLVALFFACDGHYDKDGRVIIQKVEEIQDMIRYPRNPRHRVAGQKSIFIRHPNGFFIPHEDEIVVIPTNLKKTILQHLQKYHGIYTETIYNDLYGFIRNQDVHGSASTQVYRGHACKIRGDKDSNQEEKRKEYEKAIEHYTQAIELDPDMTAAYFNRGIVYIKNNEYDHAIADFTELIKIKPDDAEVYYCRGWGYDLKGKYDCAIEDYNSAIELKPDYAAVFYNRGAVYGKKNEIDRAINDFNKAIELKPSYAEAYNNRAVAYYNKGEFDLAIENYNIAIKHKPDYTEALENRRVAYRAKRMVYYERNSSRFGIDYGEAVRQNPDDPNAYYNRGVAFLHLKLWDKARSDLITAKDMGADIVASFHNFYANIIDFEHEIGIQLPEDIVAILTPS